MHKSLLSAQVVEQCPDRPSGHSKSPQNIPKRPAASGQKSKARRRFSPLVVGFGILESGKYFVDSPARSDEAINGDDCRRSENSKEGK
jgi:hypothetical protein